MIYGGMALAILATVVLLIVHAYFSSAARLPDSTRGNPLDNPPGMVDRLVLLDRPDVWAAGKLEHAKIDAAKGNSKGSGTFNNKFDKST
jgi:hypothetical protein